MAILSNGWGTGLSAKQKQSQAWVLDPQVVSTETVAAGDGSSSAVALSTTSTVSFVTTATDSTHVSLADGITGQVKIIVHKTRSNSKNLVITPANFAAGATLTSDAASRSVTLLFDGTNWQVIAGEITGTVEFAIGS
tara:strand:+ start:476 stop:886 length:411 start_codon:yes stop_codon:yes gene_type:complete